MVTAEAHSVPVPAPADKSEYPYVEVTLRLPSEWELSYRLLQELGERNESFQFERASDGSLVVTGPPPHEGGWIELELIVAIHQWASSEGGRPFGSSYGYYLPDGALLIPDLSWLSSDQLAARGDVSAWREPFDVVPPFVTEIRSPGQRLANQQRKMEQYISNGVRLGWLFDPIQRRVHIYRPEREPEVLDDPKSLNGEDVLEGLVVDLSDIWP